MSYDSVKKFFESKGLEDHLMTLDGSGATVAEAAVTIGCEEREVAKTMSFLIENQPVLVVTSGDARVDNRKYKDTFHKKAKMIPWDSVEELVGHAPGGVNPFGVKDGVKIYLDDSLKSLTNLYPAAGDGTHAIKLTLDELVGLVDFEGWVDICSVPQADVN